MFSSILEIFSPFVKFSLGLPPVSAGFYCLYHTSFHSCHIYSLASVNKKSCQSLTGFLYAKDIFTYSSVVSTCSSTTSAGSAMTSTVSGVAVIVASAVLIASKFAAFVAFMIRNQSTTTQIHVKKSENPSVMIGNSNVAKSLPIPRPV